MRGTFGATRDSAGNIWAAVSDSQNTAQIFQSNNEGAVWTPDQTAVFPGMFLPVMQADDVGRVALFFYGATGTPTGSTTTPFLMDRLGGQCAVTRGLGDYEGMAFVPIASALGLEASTVNQWAPVWTDQAIAAPGGGTLFGSTLHTSFDGANQ